ncbi:MAG: cyclic nucleotide-binding domain-containing protein [Chitinivibrionales bacterium]|nr:cyclic nucleotide-binding domain-containing protein [Chitinivibrionales bacterium]MBD3395062.1 cyclic nucleotide-binding domain-containing protein [Chitinivibrionales bacterium]
MRYYSRIVRKYQPGEMIFSENSECDGMYIIDAGRVRVFKSMGVGAAKKEVELCTLGPKAMFGEMAMIDEHRRSASVQAVDPTTCTVITKKIFEDQLTRIPPWMVNMIKILVSRLRETNNKLRTVIEQYTDAPEDPGSLITIDEEKAEKLAAKPAPEKEKPSGEDAREKGRHFKSEEIIESLFDQDS